jgi:hypothetical protein
MQRGFLVVMGVCAALVVGCAGRAAKSAAELGCSADEITVSEAAPREGLPERGDRWTAECHGRIYECTQAYPPEGSDALELLMPEQVLCQQVAESPEEVANREAYQDAKLRTATRESRGAPRGAAGFDFGLSVEQSEQRCSAAKRAWTRTDDAVGVCSGPAADIGSDGRVSLSFCDGAACGIVVEQHPLQAWAKRAISLKKRLESKYGLAQSRSGRVSDACRGEAEFVECLRTNALHLSYGWQWSTGESLRLEIGKPSQEAEPAVRLIYACSKGALATSNL